ncbi:NifB/NifX family molybdenum-iron cluster-binding protein [Proteiniclasticum sp. C24MP]|uniref:NifB/NifX family molybdenum-iron cluster-binding protein n=1 Tax=Proteiniclasticum sp. C24MP TaxID=3374101 RepID=UPI00375539B7
MKIAIPVDEKNADTGVCSSFGRTPYFLMYDTETKQSEFIENSAVESTGGAGIKAAQSIVDQKAHVLLTPRCGENAADVLTSSDVAIYQTRSASVSDNISAFLEEELSPLHETHPGFHGHGEN